MVSAFAVAVVLGLTRPEEARSVASEKAWNVATIEVEHRPIRPSLELFGSVLSPQDAQLSAAIDGDVLELKVLDGQSIRQGDLLIVLDGRDAQLTLSEREAELRELDAQLRLAQRRLARNEEALEREKKLLEITRSKADRAQELFADSLISESDVETTIENLTRQQLSVNQGELAIEETQLNMEQLRAQLTRAKAQRDRAQLDVERSSIRAPFPGVVSDLNVSVGDRVRSGDELMRLQNPDSIEIRAQVPSRHARAVSDGVSANNEVTARVEIDDQLLLGSVVRISGQTREGSGGVDSYIRLTEIPIGIRLGATVRVLLDLPAVNEVIGAPAEALYGRDRLYKVSNDRMQMVDIERIGERVRLDGRTEVIFRSAELSDGEQIIVTKLANAVDGLLVNTTSATNRLEASASVETPANRLAASPGG